MTKIFVYGTLKTGQVRHFYLAGEGACLIGDACTAPRYALYQPPQGDYPCMVEEPEGGISVDGELWEVPDVCLKILDEVEGAPDLFQRRTIALEDGAEAQAYLMPARPRFARRLGCRW